jgi:threonyl-tRNA synthetase
MMGAAHRHDEVPLDELRHTAAHVLAYAVQDLFPDAKPTIGPAIADGFYYDFDRAVPFTPEDLERLDARMREIVAADYEMKGERTTREGAIERFKGNPYKVELAREIPEGEPITLYTIGAFTDLCRGGHAKTTGAIGAVKLTSVAGAYWRGDEHKPMLQRIYGTAWHTKGELDAYLLRVEEAQKRDHRKLGAELGLFTVDEDAGGGLIFWLPNGTIVRGIIENFIREGLAERGYQQVVTPHIVSERLFEISGHLENYAQGMYGPLEVEGQRFRLKPMNCPGHILIYRSEGRSYRDLPLRYAEFGTVYRFERSGTLHGLVRVRGFTQDDAHLFCTPEQLQSEFEQTADEAIRLVAAFGFGDVEYVLSTRDPGERTETDEIAEDAIRKALESRKLPYGVDPGGSLERLFGVLIEHYGGAFPAWLAPVQAVVTPISEHQLEYATQVRDRLRAAGLRAEVDASNEKLGYKIRHWKTQKVPYILVAGRSEVEAGTIAPNERGNDEKRPAISVDAFIDELRDRVARKV